MSLHFAHPLYFGLLIVIPIIVLGYFLATKTQQKKQGITHVNSYIVNKLPVQNVHKHNLISLSLVLCASIALIVALAGPMGIDQNKSRKATIVLLIDTSISMESTDVKPTRIIAAKVTAKHFIDELDPNVNVGLISFNSGANIESFPTTDHNRVKQKIDGLELNTYTATGQGINSALRMIAEFNEAFKGGGTSSGEIILESDGVETVPSNPDMPDGEYVMARKAKQMGIPIHTISFGTEHGTIMFRGEEREVKVDDAGLAEVAKLSGGKAFTARNMDQLKTVYSSLSHDISYQSIEMEQPFWALLCACIFMIAAIIFAYLNSLFRMKPKNQQDSIQLYPRSPNTSGVPRMSENIYQGYVGR